MKPNPCEKESIAIFTTIPEVPQTIQSELIFEKCLIQSVGLVFDIVIVQQCKLTLQIGYATNCINY